MSLQACTMTLGANNAKCSLKASHNQRTRLSQGDKPALGVNVDLYSSMESRKNQFITFIMTRPLGATHRCSSLQNQIYKVPALYCIMTRPLGATSYDVLFSKEKNMKVSSRRKQSIQHLGATLFWSKFLKSQVAASKTTRHLGLHHSVVSQIISSKLKNWPITQWWVGP